LTAPRAADDDCLSKDGIRVLRDAAFDFITW